MQPSGTFFPNFKFMILGRVFIMPQSVRFGIPSHHKMSGMGHWQFIIRAVERIEKKS
jgi:hypothetical protein